MDNAQYVDNVWQAAALLCWFPHHLELNKEKKVLDIFWQFLKR